MKQKLSFLLMLILIAGIYFSSCKKKGNEITLRVVEYSTEIPIANASVIVEHGSLVDSMEVQTDNSGYCSFPDFGDMRITPTKEGYLCPGEYVLDANRTLSEIAIFRKGVVRINITSDLDTHDSAFVVCNAPELASVSFNERGWDASKFVRSKMLDTSFVLTSLTNVTNHATVEIGFYDLLGDYVFVPIRDTTFWGIEGDTIILNLKI